MAAFDIFLQRRVNRPIYDRANTHPIIIVYYATQAAHSYIHKTLKP